jgi:predicted SprT family Zn-dependent metalloprotease
MGTFINLDFNPEWHIIEILPKIQSIYDQINKNFYKDLLPKMKICWTEQSEIHQNDNFKICLKEGSVALNQTTLLLRPRIDLFSVIIHITIHLYLHTNSSGKIIEITEHDSNFRKLAKHFNDIFRCQIIVSRLQ